MRKRIPYGRQFIDGADIRAVTRVLRSDWLTQGPAIRDFEDALRRYTGAAYAVAVANGTAALHIACLAAGVRSGHEVITSPITFVASANCAVYCGAKPVFADICQDTLNIDPAELGKRVTRRTRAIIPVHFSGTPCNMKAIDAIARARGIPVIEDACHALGAVYGTRKIGACAHSDMTVFSFHPVKHITTGEGGAVMTNDRGLYERLLLLRNHGITKDKGAMSRCEGPWYYEMQTLGYNYRITDIQCALGMSQMKKLPAFLKRRREIAAIYNCELAALKGIELPREHQGSRSAWHIYCIRIRDARKRGAVIAALEEAGIGTQVHYIPVHLQPYYRKRFGYRKGDYPVAERYYREAVTIPLFFSLKDREIVHIVRKVKDIVGRS